MLIFYLKLLLLFTSIQGNFNECDFEKDECGWFSGESIGIGAWTRVTTEELEVANTDVHPSKDAADGKTGRDIYLEWDSRSELEHITLVTFKCH